MTYNIFVVRGIKSKRYSGLRNEMIVLKFSSEKIKCVVDYSKDLIGSKQVN
jgi:hypothetical protein